MIKEFNERLNNLAANYRIAKREIELERDFWIGKQWPMYKSGKFVIAEMEYDQWECKESPIDICVYNKEDDPMHDFCHFCGQPEERR